MGKSSWNIDKQELIPCCLCGKVAIGPIVTIHDYDSNNQVVLIKRFEYCLDGKGGHLFHKICDDCSNKMRKKDD